MAYEAYNEEDEQKVQQGFGTQGTQQTNLTTQAENAPTLGGQQSNLVQGVAGQQTQQVQGGQSNTTTGQKSSGMGARLSNLKKYIQANQNTGMAQGIQKGIEDIRTGVQKDIGQSQQKLQSNVAGEKARLSKGEQLIQASAQGGGGVFEKGRSEAYTQDISPAQSQTQVPDFSQFGKTATERLGEFGKYRTGEAQQFDIENQAELERQSKELQKRADLSQSEAGRYQLLRETFGRPAYTTGQQRLDQLLLQAQPEESKTLAEMAKTINKPVQEELKRLQGLRDTENLAIKSQAQTLAGQIGTGLTGAQGEFTSALEQAKIAAATKIGQDYAQVQSKIQRGEPLTQDDMVKLGRGEDQNAKDFLDYYQRGVQSSISENLAAGKPLSEGQLDRLTSLKTPDGQNFFPLSKTEIQEIQNMNPISPEDFIMNKGVNGRWNEQLQQFEYKPSKYSPYKRNEVLTNEYNQYTQDIINNKLAIQDMFKQAVEISPEVGNYREAQALDFGQYLKSLTPEDIAISKIATQEDYARQAALEALATQGFGPLQATQIAEAGTIGNVGVGRYDLEKALSMAREYYNPTQTNEYARVSAPGISPDLTIGEKVARETQKAGVQLLGDNKYGQGLGDVGAGSISAYTDVATAGEKSLSSLLAGDIKSGVGEALAGSANYAMSDMTTPLAMAGGIERMITGGQNIKKLNNSIKSVSRKITRAAGSFWCTKVFKSGLVSKSEYVELNKFLKRIMFTHARFLSWYIDNGTRILELADQKGFDWNIGKELLFDKLLSRYKLGNIKGSVECYDEFTVKICEFVGEIPPYECRKSGLLDSLRFLPKVLKFYWSK